VSGARREPEERAIEKNRLLHTDVGKVPGPHPRVVGNEDITGSERLRRKLGEEVTYGSRQGTDEGGDTVRCLGDGTAGRIGENA